METLTHMDTSPRFNTIYCWDERLKMEIGLQAAVPRHTENKQTKSLPVSLIEGHFHYSRQDTAIHKAADSEWPVGILVTLHGKLKKQMWSNSLPAHHFATRNHYARHNNREYLRFLVFPEIWTCRRHCVLHLNSSTVSQTLCPSFQGKEWKPKLQHVEVCFSR